MTYDIQHDVYTPQTRVTEYLEQFFGKTPLVRWKQDVRPDVETPVQADAANPSGRNTR